MAANSTSVMRRDAVVFPGAIVLLLATIWIAVSFGVSFGPEPGIAAWAIGLVFVAMLVFGASVWWWFYVNPDEREPARGEFTRDAAHHLRPGEGSYRTKELHHAGASSEGVHFEGGAAFNPGVTRRLVVAATVALALGLLVRVAGMVGALGMPQVPVAADILLTVLGGVVAFGAFLVLDTA